MEKKDKIQKEKKASVKEVKSSFFERGEKLSEKKEKAFEKIRRDRKQFRFKDKDRKPKDEFDVRLVSIRRVAKVKVGGKRLRMSVLVVLGDRKGHVGAAIGKGRDVRDAQEKAINKAKKRMIEVPLKGQTIPHEIVVKYGAAKIFMKPAAPGTGVIAGGAIRSVVEVAGIKDILTKVLGSRNLITNVYATLEALKQLRFNRFEKYGTK